MLASGGARPGPASAAPSGDCSERKVKWPAGSFAAINRTAPLQRLQTPSKRTTAGVVLTARSAFRERVADDGGAQSRVGSVGKVDAEVAPDDGVQVDRDRREQVGRVHGLALRGLREAGPALHRDALVEFERRLRAVEGGDPIGCGPGC